jgi:hypothetical protein
LYLLHLYDFATNRRDGSRIVATTTRGAWLGAGASAQQQCGDGGNFGNDDGNPCLRAHTTILARIIHEDA